MCQLFDHVTWHLVKFSVFMWLSIFMKSSFQGLDSFCILVFFLIFFKANLEISFLTFTKNVEIQDGVSKMADFLSVWRNFYVMLRHNWHVTLTKINIFGCFTHNISSISIACIIIEIHRGEGRRSAPSAPGSLTKNKSISRIGLTYCRTPLRVNRASQNNLTVVVKMHVLLTVIRFISWWLNLLFSPWGSRNGSFYKVSMTM